MGIRHRRGLRLAGGAGASLELADWPGEQRVLPRPVFPKPPLRRHGSAGRVLRAGCVWLVELALRRRKSDGAPSQPHYPDRVAGTGSRDSRLRLGAAGDSARRERRRAILGCAHHGSQPRRPIPLVPETI